MTLLSFVVGIIATIFITKDFQKFKKPLSRFNRFLYKKMKQGEKLYKSKLEDVVTKKLPPKLNYKTRAMDYSQIQPFRKYYAEWRRDVIDGIKFATKNGNGNVLNGAVLFGDKAIPTPYAIYGGFRKPLKKDLDSLKFLLTIHKSEHLTPRFKKEPENISEYEDFKLP
jgi:hypothetical protein